MEIDVECEVELSRPGATDDPADTVSYSDVAQIVAGVAEGRRHGLLEALATDCVSSLFARFPTVASVRIEVRKPEALPGPGVPFVRIGRSRAGGLDGGRSSVR